MQEAWAARSSAAVLQQRDDFVVFQGAVSRRHPEMLSREAARFLHSGSLGSKRFGNSPRVSDLLSLREWTYFLAGGQEITCAFLQKSDMDSALIVSIQVAAGSNKC